MYHSDIGALPFARAIAHHLGHLSAVAASGGTAGRLEPGHRLLGSSAKVQTTQ